MAISRSSALASVLLIACAGAKGAQQANNGLQGQNTANQSTGGSGASPTNTSPATGGRAAAGAGMEHGAAGSAQGTSGKPALAAGATAGISGGAGGGDGGGSLAVGSGGANGGSGSDTGSFPAVTDFVGDGPYTSTTISSTGPNNNYTVYLPMQAPPEGAKNPIVGWMSGGSTSQDLYPLLPHLATHGFVVVASNSVPGIGDEINLGKEIIAGIDWAIAENARQDSPLFDRLDTTKLASMGYSMGSLATFTIANDPRLTTTVHISGGNMASERISNLHAPAAFLCGIPGDDSCNILSTDCDIAAANCDIDFMNATTPVFYANFPGGHLGILTPPNQDVITGAATAWLRWQLMADNSLKSRFVGADCTLCKDTNWQKVQQKHLE